MKVITLHHPYHAKQIPTESVVMVLGFFDGVHRGHQAVINEGKKQAEARGLKLAVMTFNQHPSIVFKKIEPGTMKYLTTVEQKARRMEELGVDYLYVVEFTSAFASLAPQDFVDQYIVGLHAQVAVAGFDYTYGPKDIASMAQLPSYSQNRFEVVRVEKQEALGDKISSTAIRAALEAGKMEEVTHLLGYDYETEGVVVHGDARGRTLGYPTANIRTPQKARLPKNGVYAVEFEVANKTYHGMAQIGYNITFEKNREKTVEVNILDFDADIYGEQVSVRWCHYLRGEIKFDGPEGLIAQLNQDKIDTREYFEKRGA
ncbi:riboflavin biosynthesis protein RibF [Vagococcus lutrae]|uniref:riboflavin biosynthesis protein RibF n=1 Tax=Vagococcus lutrae TaxID=81947 RepID=UPI00200BD11F|nr:riboflavin biosynthesis protein RibF [Vagococcus lutrae]UQF38909.1 riboflavin biosynthesis protein RibF [Vagococcus lutrae]